MIPIITPMTVPLLFDEDEAVMTCVDVETGRMAVTVEAGALVDAAVRMVGGVCV